MDCQSDSEGKVDPENILAVTFNKAAREMKERIQKLFAEQLAVQNMVNLLSCYDSRLGCDRASIKSSSKIYGLAPSTASSPVSSGLILKNTKMKRTLESQLFHL